MCRAARLLSCSCRTRDPVDHHVVSDKTQLGGWQQTKLYAGGKASRVGEMLCFTDCLAMYLGQSVYVIVVSLDTEVLSHIYNLNIRWNRVFFKKSFTLAMTKTEEYHVDFVERHLICETKISLTIQSFMDITHSIACIALTISKDYLCLGMIYQKSY